LRKVLIISYYFPPHPEVASVRLGGLAKYLPAFGWEPIVLTISFPGELDTNVEVIKTPYNDHDVIRSLKIRLGFNPQEGFLRQMGIMVSASSKNSISDSIIKWFSTLVSELLAYPDPQREWYTFAVKMGKELLQRERIDAMISSSTPATSHLIARSLKLEYNKPWIADLRDLWTQAYYYPWSSLRRAIEERLELRTLQSADALVTVSKPLAEKLAALHKHKLVYSILNGFDPENFVDAHVSLTDKFTITYTGGLYNGKQDPSMLFEAIRKLISSRIISAQETEIRFFGPRDNIAVLETLIKTYRLQGVVRYYGFVPRNEALEKQHESQLLLLLDWVDPIQQGVYTGKIFEYLAAQRPILAVGGLGGVVKELLEDTNAGVHTSGLEDLQAALLKYYSEYKSIGRVIYRGHKDKVQKYNHWEMARKFAQALEEVCIK
jgi:glycosyltransferase involved in cell wall biosynthesis